MDLDLKLLNRDSVRIVLNLCLAKVFTASAEGSLTRFMILFKTLDVHHYTFMNNCYEKFSYSTLIMVFFETFITYWIDPVISIIAY